MNKHEVEALKQLTIRWWENSRKATKHKEAGAWGSCRYELEDFINSLPAPDEGLREGLEALVKELTDKEDQLQKVGYCLRAEITTELIVDIKELLAKTPDGWKPIADAPRDISPTSEELLQEHFPKTLKVLENRKGKKNENKHT